MSKGSRRKHAARPWQRGRSAGDLRDLLASPGRSVLHLEGHEVRLVGAERAVKDYVCPGCGNTIPAGEGHVVVWPEGEADLRRHWHRHCWRHEVRRRAGA